MSDSPQGDAPERGQPLPGGERPGVREIRDARVLRALAHPLRLSLLEELLKAGPATATELAERLGESPANCSWHLRQLARYGYIEEAEGGAGRQRPWRLAAKSQVVPSKSTEGHEFDRARDALLEVLLERSLRDFRGWWLRDRHGEPPQWQDASFVIASWDFLTAEELAAFKRELDDVYARHVLAHRERLDPERRGSGARPVRFVAWAFPAGPFRSPQPPTHPDD